ncbi:hypothetical protein REIS_2160 (plasmid) [Rickettsia endosymbiont of Ixodes scapularis]|nr:hypothetical protein REIS_2160 [Rickettsia endosymbiont of Ixodes scapularis]
MSQAKASITHISLTDITGDHLRGQSAPLKPFISTQVKISCKR